MNIYLHVGMPKTATTFLQARCFPYFKGLKYQNNDIRDLVDRIIYTNPIFLDLKRTRQEFDALLRNVDEETLLISQERLFGNMLRNYHDNVYLASCLKAVFPNAKLIIVIRRQDELVESIYKQSLQSWHHQRINSFLNYRHGSFADSDDQLGLPSLDVKQMDLYRYVQNYVEHFGRENVFVLPYELLRHDQRAFLERLAAILKVEPIYPPGNNHENRGYSWLSCRIALLLNRFVRVEGDGSRLLQFIPNKPFLSYLNRRAAEKKIYKTLGGISRRLTLRYFLQNGLDRVVYIRRNLISKHKRESIMAFHRESNARLDQEFNLNLKRFGYH
jgi:Sulfotransferase family